MFEVYDIVTFGTILIIVFFLFILFQIESNFTRPRIYLRIALLFALIILGIEELIALEYYAFGALIYPLVIASYFMIYPFVYIYSRNLVFDSGQKEKARIIYILILPAAVLLYLGILFYPLDYNSKIKFMTLHLSEASPDLPGYTLYQYLIMILYYLQTIVYMTATIRLIYAVGGNPAHWKNNKNKNPWDLLLIKYLMLYVVSVIIYEILVAFTSIIFTDDLNAIRISEILLSLLFVSLGLYIAFKQSLIVIQSKIYKYSDKLVNSSTGNEKSVGSIDLVEQKNSGTNQNLLRIEETGHLQNSVKLSEKEKSEIKEAIENFLDDSRIYLDPNLKLEQLSKRTHIPSRKISSVVNEVFGTNFNHFINEYRISAAKKIILSNPDGIIIESIFTKVGFNSRSSFNRVFKESTGLSPIEYIKSKSKHK